MKKIAGLDVHGKSCTFLVQNEAGERIAGGEFETTIEAIAAWVAEHELKGCQVAMESGAISVFVSRQLISNGVDAVIVNAAEVRSKARSKRQKSDKRDAFEICDGFRRGVFVCIVHLPDAFSQRLREILSSRRHFIRARTRETNSIKGLLRKNGLAKFYRTLTTEKAFEKLLAIPLLDASAKQTIESHRALWRCCQEQIKNLDEQLEAIAAERAKTVEQLTTAPGVGRIVALTTLAYFAAPERFSSAKHAASYTGLVTQTYHSSDRQRFGHITGRGPNELRCMLVEAAQNARRKNHPLHAFYCRIAQRKGPKVAVVAVAHRMARILWAMLKNQTSFDPTRLTRSKAWDSLLAAA